MAGGNQNGLEKEFLIAQADSEMRFAWFDGVKDRLEHGKPEHKRRNSRGGKGSSVSINRVPAFLKGLNTDAYVPRVVSLGLFNRTLSLPLSQIEQYKVAALERIVKSLPEGQQDARFVMEKVRLLLPDITMSYEEKVECEEEILAWVFTLDGCFLLEILRLLTSHSEEWNLDPVFNKNRVQSCQNDILSDILFLENQIPIIVLIKILAMEYGPNESLARTELLKMICDAMIAIVHPFSYKLHPKTREEAGENSEQETQLMETLKKYEDLKEFNHILGFFHDFIVREAEGENPERKGAAVEITISKGGRHDRLPHRRHQAGQQRKAGPNKKQEKTIMACATELYKNGMNFKAYMGVPMAGSIRFDKEKKIMYLPTISITDNTEVVLRNLMAVDVCQEKELTVISEYVFLMNSLIESAEDVALLRKKGIIENSIGTDKEACDLLNNLSKGVNFHYADKDEFEELKAQVNDWYKRKLSVKMSELIEEHPRLLRYAAMFWGAVLVVAAAPPSFATLFKQIMAQQNK